MELGELISGANDALAEAWGTLFQKKIELGDSVLATVGTNECGEHLSGKFAICSLAFTGDVSGQATIVLNEKDALTMVGMMMSMGADDALVTSTRDGELGAEQLDALQEVMNQTGATMATVWRDKLGCSLQVSCDPATTVEFEGKIDSSDDDHLVQTPLTLEGFDPSHLFMTLEAPFAEVITADSIEPKAEEAGETAESGESSSPAESSEESPEVLKKLENVMDMTIKPEVILAEREIDFTELMKLNVGSVMQFWKDCDSPAELCLGDRILANGEIVTFENQRFGLRVFEMAPEKQGYRRN